MNVEDRYYFGLVCICVCVSVFVSVFVCVVREGEDVSEECKAVSIRQKRYYVRLLVSVPSIYFVLNIKLGKLNNKLHVIKQERLMQQRNRHVKLCRI